MTYAVVRIRSPRNKNAKIERTLGSLSLEKVNRCSIVPQDDVHKGMLEKVKDVVTWGEVEKDVLVDMIKYHSDLETEDIEDKISEDTSYDSIEEFAEGIIEGEEKLSTVGLEKFFRMHPPEGGFKDIKKPYNTGGSLEYRQVDINQLLKRMFKPSIRSAEK